MRSQALFFLTIALLTVLARSSNRHHHHHSHVQSRGQGAASGGGGGGELASRGKAAARAWPCCDSCGGCTRSEPRLCRCLDAAPRGCHPACRDCVKSSLSADPPVYQCMDRVPDFCLRRCTAPAAAAR
ncbi:Bowman-Birk type trypsin inhibitor [Zea mays]|uniref:Bowman-Birk type trypsin inhibitor n=1 Tax=Zea mays TaxID=4577 RepID=A0A1D6LA07_MAIZE|nr:Bowman-Birk type trypsin inhibitor [Zea mays]ONM10970.1 Bowman-Birk type trypsin inhibitor [Zea mays]|eukprot:XP_008665690.1 Bowman-Birk type trypsin inhibitor [Zea mays]